MTFVVVQADEVIDGGDDVFAGEGALSLGNGEGKLFVELVASDTAKVIALVVEEAAVEDALTAGHGGRVTGSELSVDFNE